MGDISEYRGLIFAGTFVLIAFFIIGMIPAPFTVAYEEPSHKPRVPDYIDASLILSWNSSYTIWWGNLTYSPTEGIYYDAWGKAEFGHDLLFGMYNNTGTPYMYMQHGDYPWWGLGGFNPWHNMEWFNDDNLNRGETLTLDELDEDLGTNSNTNYKLVCEDFFMKCNLGYDSDSFVNLTAAWNNNGVGLVFGIDYDQMGSTHNAFSIIGNILSLDANITGNIWIDTLIKVPLMIAAAYIAFIVVLRIIGSVFGGGGA